MADFNPIYNGRVTATGTADPHRGPTPDIFRGVNFYNQNPEHPLAVFEDFRFNTSGLGTITLNAGTVTHGVAEGGEILLNTTATENQGPTIQFTGCGVTPTAGTAVCFEARVKVSALHHYLFGLFDLETAPIGTGAIGTADDFAVFTEFGGLTLDFTIDATGGTADPQAGVHPLVADTYFKAGFRGVVGKSIDVYINGAKVTSSALAVANFPNKIVYPTFAAESSTTAGEELHVDWFALAVADGVSE